MTRSVNNKRRLTMVRRRRHSPKSKYGSISVYSACAAALCASCLLYWTLSSKRPARAAPDTAPAAARDDRAAVRPAALGRPHRSIYPYSVIRGGAYSAGEFEAALRTDPVVAAHYAVFDRGRIRMIAREPEQPASVYVSYRQGNRIYWTRRKVRLAAEETLLTDGVHLARARCGNRISLTPPDAAQAGEPDVDLDVPEPPPAARADEPAGAPPDVSSLPILVHEIFPPFLGDWLPNPGPGGSAGAPGLAGTAYPTSHAGPSPPGYRFPLLPVVPPPPPQPNVWPIDFATPTFPPAGPGIWPKQPVLPPGSPTAGPPGGSPTGGIAPYPPAFPPLPGIPTIPETPTVPGASGFPGDHGGSPPGATPPQIPPGEPDPKMSEPELPWTPTPPLPNALDLPEPASAALLLCGLLALACRRRSARRRE